MDGFIEVMGLNLLVVVLTGLLLAGILTAYWIYHFQSRQHQRRGMNILGYVEAAIRLNLPLDAYLRAAEASEFGTTRRRLQQLRDALARGASVARALYSSVPELPPETLASIAAAEPLGQFRTTLARLVGQDTRSRPDPRMERLPFYRFYALALIATIINLLTFFVIFVLPRFQEIFQDFRATFPPATMFLLKLSPQSMEPALAILAIGLIAIVMITIIVWLLAHAFIPHRPSLERLSLFDRVAWYIPVGSGLSRSRSMAAICQLLADATRAAVTLPDALSAATLLHVNSRAKTQLRDWREGLLAGNSTAASAQNAGLPPLLVGLLNPSQSSRAANPQSAADAFDFLARYYRGKFSRLILVLQAAAEPALVLALGLIVGFFTYALFSPLVALIQTVAGLDGGGVL